MTYVCARMDASGPRPRDVGVNTRHEQVGYGFAPNVAEQDSTPCNMANKFSQVLRLVPFCCKCARALSFENVCQDLHARMMSHLAQAHGGKEKVGSKGP